MLLHQLPCIQGSKLIMSVSILIQVFFVFSEEMGCTDNWKRLHCSCYSFFPQNGTQKLKSWKESRKDCEDKQADLATITTGEEQVSCPSLNIQRSVVHLSPHPANQSSLSFGHSPFLSNKEFVLNLTSNEPAWVGLKSDSEQVWRLGEGTLPTNKR